MWSHTLTASGGGLATNWKPVFFFLFLAFCWFCRSSWSVFRDSQIPFPWQHCRARTETEELLFGYSRGTYDANRPLCGVTDTSARQICLFRIHWLHWLFFNVICAFFSTGKKRTHKKNHKKTWKIQHKNNNSVSLYTLYTEQAHILCQHTHSHTHTHTHTHTQIAVSLLTAPHEIRLIRFRKIIIKLMNRVGKQNTAWQALLQTHTPDHVHTHTHTHTSWNYMFCSQIFFHSRNLATLV